MVFSFQGIVYGHAVPDGYSLQPNSLIDKLQAFPGNISILFSERPDPKVSHIHVVDSKGQRIDNDDFRITGQDGREGSISLDKNPRIATCPIITGAFMTAKMGENILLS